MAGWPWANSGMKLLRLAEGVEGWASGIGLRRFRNGGAPLFERRDPNLVVELLMAPRPRDAVSLRIFVSIPDLAESRRRGMGRLGIPNALAGGGDIGGLVPGVRAIEWNLNDPLVEPELLALLQGETAPWLAAWDDPVAWRARAYAGGMALVTRAATAEVLFHWFGRAEAERYLVDVALRDPEERRIVAEALERMARRALAGRVHPLALIADTYRLRVTPSAGGGPQTGK